VPPVPVRSPISGKGTSGLPKSPGARSMPGVAKDSVPVQPHHGTSAQHSEGKLPEPSMKTDAINGAVEHHLIRHRLSRLPCDTD
jgi:hypothetical protein